MNCRPRCPGARCPLTALSFSLSLSVCLPLLPFLPFSFLSQQPSPSRKSCVRYPPPPPPPAILDPTAATRRLFISQKSAYFENSSRCTFRFRWKTAFRGRRQFPISTTKKMEKFFSTGTRFNELSWLRSKTREHTGNPRK